MTLRFRFLHQPLPAMLALLFLLSMTPPTAWSEETGFSSTDEQKTEDAAGPTPLQEFAPEDAPQAWGKNYDQGVTVSKVTIEGNRLINTDEIKKAMATRPGALFNRTRLQRDLKRIHEMGYFTDKIRAVPISTNEGIVLRIEVEENAPVTGVNIDGNTIVSDADLQKIFESQTGLPQNIGQLNESIEKIEKLYGEKGYILARVTAISDDPDGVINLHVNEGVIDKVQFVGNRKTKDYVLKRDMATKAGDVYNEQLVKEDLKRIFSTQSFSDVRRVITASPDNPDRYNLTVELDEKRTGAISLGGGVDTGTGVFGSLGYSDPNFLGRGQDFRSMLAVGTGVIGRDQTQADARTFQFEVGWSTPSLMDSPNALATSLYGRDLASFNIPLGIERRIGGEVTWTRPLLSLKNTSFSLTGRAERVSLREGASDSDLEDFNLSDSERKAQLEGGTFISLTPTLAYDSRDNRFDPTRGWLASTSLGANYGLSNNSYGSLSANVRKYFKIRDGLTLALNAQGGTSFMGDIPEFNMFRLGGAYSVRGFQEGGLGTGSGFLLGSAELRSRVPFLSRFDQIPFLDNIRMAFFVDAGTVIGESVSSKAFERAGLGASMGAGLRFNIPGLGPIRVDYAIPIAGGGKYTRKFNFGLGQKF